MSVDEKRELSYVEWRNHWAWMERMKGKRWENLLHREKGRYNGLVAQKGVHHTAKQMEQEITNARQYLYLTGFQAGSGRIDITTTPDTQFYWKRSWHKRYKKAYDLDTDQEHVWYITDSDAPYVNQLVCEDHRGNKKWAIKKVTSEVAIIGTHCYYIITDIQGRTKDTLYVCDAATGQHAHKIYEEKNEERSIGLIKGSYQTLYLLSDDPLQSKTYRIHGTHVLPIVPHTQFQMPLGYLPDQGDMGLVRDKMDTPWRPYGRVFADWKLPEEEMVWMNVSTGHAITIREGSESLWFCSPSVNPKPILRLKAGSFFYNSWEAWEQSTHQRFMVQSPYQPPFLLRAFQDKLVRESSQWPIARPLSFPSLEVHKWHTPSADGTRIPYVVLYEKGVKPIGQLVYVYGAYGSSTPVQWPHSYWYPLLKRKWAIVYAYVRGGGDHDEAWADEARRDNRHRSVDDYEAVIRAAQHRLRLTPRQTVMYGRSAGGVPVGAMVARWPNGEVAGAAFTEVPYVDILRTSTNPTLPLTVGEYQEFGNPIKRVTNFRELLRVSPINSLPAEGAPNVFVLSRVGLQDKQVYAYESFKWIQRLRGYVSPEEEKKQDDSDPKGKYVTFERKEKHVYDARVFPHFRGLDLAILDAWIHRRLQV